MSSQPYEGGKEVFTLAEIQLALAEEGEKIPEIVLGALTKFVEERRAKEAQEQLHAKRLKYARDMCISHRRVTGGNTRFIESWMDSLDTAATRALHYASTDGEALTPLQAEARDTAALVHVAYEIDRGDIQHELLEKSGVDMGWVLGVFKEVIVQRAGKENESPESREMLDKAVTSLEDLSTYLYCVPEVPELTYGPRLESLAENLEASGKALPRLGNDGLYDTERIDY